MTPSQRAAKKQKNKEYYLANRDKVIAAQKRWQIKHKDRRKRIVRNSTLKRLYGITHEVYDKLAFAQGWRCAICRRKKQVSCVQGEFCLDHCHETQKVRGLLCDNCNRAIGLLHDDWTRAKALYLYLKSSCS